MPVLCIDTATDALVVALVDDRGGDVEVLAEEVRRDLRAQAVLELVEACCERAGVARGAIEQVVVGTGPGGFTGLRIGIATARGIAVGLGVGLVGVPTAAAIAAPDLADGTGPTGDVRTATIDARRGELFRQDVRRGEAEDGEPWAVLEGPLSAVPVAEVPGGAAPEAPTGRGLALAARGRAACDPREVLPTYGREPDAQPAAVAATGVAGGVQP